MIMPKNKWSPTPDPISRTKASKPARGAIARHAQTRSYSERVVSAEAAVDRASASTQRRIAGGGKGKLGGGGISRRLAGRR
jgi:hypothetical protein